MPTSSTTLAQVVDDDKASLVSNSWGDLEENSTSEGVAAYEQVFLQGAMQGIGFLFSSGDNGDEVANSGSEAGRLPDLGPLRHLGRRHVRRHRPGRHVPVPDRMGHREVRR